MATKTNPKDSLLRLLALALGDLERNRKVTVSPRGRLRQSYLFGDKPSDRNAEMFSRFIRFLANAQSMGIAPTGGSGFDFDQVDTRPETIMRDGRAIGSRTGGAFRDRSAAFLPIRQSSGTINENNYGLVQFLNMLRAMNADPEF